MNRAIRKWPALIAICLVSLFCVGSAMAQTKIPRVGLLFVHDPRNEPWMEIFRATLREQGWVEGKNVAFEYRDAGGDPMRFVEPAAELIRLNVDVLFPIGPPAVRAVAAATRDIPIVAHDFETDPVIAGYAKSYSRPGGNLTGVFLDSPDLAGKWLELLKDIRPKLSRITVLWDSTSGPIPLEAVRTVGPSLGITPQVLELRTPRDIDKVQSRFRGPPQALVILPSPMLYAQSAQLAEVAGKSRLPATSMFVPFAEAGGLIAYGPDIPASVEQCAKLIAKVLGGARPADLPVERPTKFQFVVNMKTARALGVTVPDRVLLRADRVIR
jgi:putative ABC transport system substrate-binding protein